MGAVAAAVALLRLIPGVNPTTAGFALLMLVLLAATIGPLWIAITVAVASTLSFNYFFFPPVGTFSIAEAHNWVSLLAFLVTALIGSNLSAAAQERARIAVERAQFLEEREATELQRQRGELAATLLASLSHDLKTPLTVIRDGDRQPSRPAAGRDSARTGRRRRSRAEPPDAAVRRHPRHGADRRGGDPRAREWVTPADVVDAALAHVRHAIDGHSLRVEADGEHAVNSMRGWPPSHCHT